MPALFAVDAAHAVWQFPGHPRTIRRARAVLREQFADWRLTGDAAEVAELLLSELVTNAYRHGHVPGRDIGVEVAVQDGRLRLEVSDASDDKPQPRPATDDDDHGRGLILLAALADEWGVTPRPYGIGKTVWAVLTLQPGPVDRVPPGEIPPDPAPSAPPAPGPVPEREPGLPTAAGAVHPGPVADPGHTTGARRPHDHPYSGPTC